MNVREFAFGFIMKTCTAITLLITLLFTLLSVFGAATASAADPVGQWKPLMERLVRDGMDEHKLRALFSRSKARYDPKYMSRKLVHRESGLSYDIFLKPERLLRAHAYLSQHRELFAEIEKEFGVPGEIETAILLVETDLGGYTGKDLAFNVLASMAQATDIGQVRHLLPDDQCVSPEREKIEKRIAKKSSWAYSEFKALIKYADQNGLDPLALKGSIFGAIGLCQFMPSNAIRFGIDYDGNGKVDLFTEADALASIGNYVRHFGWRDGIPREKQEKVILRYNYSRPYARTILAVAERLREMKKEGSAFESSVTRN